MQSNLQFDDRCCSARHHDLFSRCENWYFNHCRYGSQRFDVNIRRPRGNLYLTSAARIARARGFVETVGCVIRDRDIDNIENDVERKKQSIPIEDGLRGRADVRDLARRCNFFVCFALCQGLCVVDASWINPFSFDSRSAVTKRVEHLNDLLWKLI